MFVWEDTSRQVSQDLSTRKSSSKALSSQNIKNQAMIQLWCTPRATWYIWFLIMSINKMFSTKRARLSTWPKPSTELIRQISCLRKKIILGADFLLVFSMIAQMRRRQFSPEISHAIQSSTSLMRGLETLSAALIINWLPRAAPLKTPSWTAR